MDETQEDAREVPSVEVPMLQTRVRQTLTPYLPPPVIRGIQEIDAKLLDTVGPEASVTILSTLLVSWLTISILRFLSSRVGRSKGRAIADEDEDAVLSGSSLKKVAYNYDATVLLCGPTKAGKTRLYYQLCYHAKNMPTVMSIKANVGLSRPAATATATAKTTDDTKENAAPKEPVIRYMDWPGHASLDDPTLKQVLQSHPRIVLVLDATQPAAPAADTLDQLLSVYAASTKKKSTQTIPIFVACNKKDFPKAKNWRRCKIQIRTELERLLSVRQGSDDPSWWPKGEALDLEKLPGGVRLHFASTSCEDKDSPELERFCRTGELPTEEAP